MPLLTTDFTGFTEIPLLLRPSSFLTRLTGLTGFSRLDYPVNLVNPV
jgi:hypothetical protein